MPNLPTRLSTPRLVLRAWDASDRGALYDLHRASAEGLHRWYGGILSGKRLTEDDVAAYIGAAQAGFADRGWIEYAAFEQTTGALVGAVSLHHLDWTAPKGRVGYFVDARQTGHGYATEMAAAITRLVFSTLGLQRLEIRAATGNAASHAALATDPTTGPSDHTKTAC